MTSSPDHCAGCGMRWTTPDEVWRPVSSLWTCGCARHASPLEHERLLHGAGRHSYRAWSKAQAQRSEEVAARMRQRREAP